MVGGSLCPFPACLALVCDYVEQEFGGEMVLARWVPTLLGPLPDCGEACSVKALQGWPQAQAMVPREIWGHSIPLVCISVPLTQHWADQCRFLREFPELVDQRPHVGCCRRLC